MSINDICIAVFSMILLSLNIIISKIGLTHFPPLLFTALRFFSVIPFLYFFPVNKFPFKNVALISLCYGIIYFGGINFALYSGVTAGICMIIIQSSVFFTFLLSIVLFKKWPTKSQIIGTIIGFMGICIICSISRQICNINGILLLLISSISFSIGTVYVKKFSYEPFSLNIWISVFSTLPMLLLSLIFEKNIPEKLFSATFSDWNTIFFAGWISTVLAGAGWSYILKKYDLNMVAPFRLMIPILGIFFASLFLKEYYHPSIWIGTGIVGIGLTIAQWETIQKLIPFNFKKNKINKYSAVPYLVGVIWASHSNAQSKIIPVAIIGSGYAGLSAASVISEYGYNTTVFTGPLEGGDLNI